MPDYSLAQITAIDPPPPGLIRAAGRRRASGPCFPKPAGPGE